MHDPWPAFGTAGQSSAPSNKRVDECVVPMTRCGVHHQAGGLIDDGQVIVLEDKRERNCGRYDSARRLMLRNPHRNALAPAKDPRGASRLSIDCDELVGNEPGCLSS